MDDISDFAVVDHAERGAEMPLLNPYTGAHTGAFLLVRGGDSTEVAAAVREVHSAQMETPEEDKMPAEQFVYHRQKAIAKAAVFGWRDFKWKGEFPDFDPKLLSEIVEWSNSGWLVSQIERFANKRRNFMPRGSSD